MSRACVVAAGFLALLSGGATARAGSLDFGERVEKALAADSENLFGVEKPLLFSSTASVSNEEALANPLVLIKLARGLTARVVTAGVAAPNIDMMALWPDDTQPTWLIACNEQDTEDPGLQRIEIATGIAQTILTGTSDCDGVRRTPWGTILFSEEGGGGPTGGRVYEPPGPAQHDGRDPRSRHGYVLRRHRAENLAVRPALGRNSFEGFAVFDNGLVYYGDENRPSQGTAGGAYFKFVPSEETRAGGLGALEDSPLVSGSIYGLRVGLRSGATDYGQGTQYGFGAWVLVCSGDECNDIDLRAQSAALSLTGYYRPEDIDIDRAAQATGFVHFCSNNTGNETDDQLWGETVCISDGTQAQALTNSAVPEIQLFYPGNPSTPCPTTSRTSRAAATGSSTRTPTPDTSTPHNDDLWDCLPDGGDANLLSDGCVRIATLNDLTAEWTGGIFNLNGQRFFVSVQHNISGVRNHLRDHGLELGRRPALRP